MSGLVEISQDQARALAIRAQGLDAQQAASVNGLYAAVQQLGCVQIDPISHVARTQYLVLRNRSAHADIAALDADLRALQFEQRRVFEHWAHCASLVLTDDYPIFAEFMAGYRYPSKATTTWQHRAHAWIKTNSALRMSIMREIKRKGPLPSSAFEDKARDSWQSTGWTDGRNVSKMIDYLWIMGLLTVVGRSGNSRIWDLTERALPADTARKPWPSARVAHASVLKAVRALGVGTRQHIMQHFTRGRYTDLDALLPRMVQRGELIALDVRDWPGTWYALPDAFAERSKIDVESMPALVLSPFDNLICDRKRTKLMFGFDFTIEIYVPAAKRKFGYYVLPVLQRGKLIGRVDSQFERAANRYRVDTVYREAQHRWSRADERAVQDALDKLGLFLRGAS